MTYRNLLPRLSGSLLGTALLLVGIVLALVAWRTVAQADARALAEIESQRFDHLADDLQSHVNESLVLLGGLQGLFAASDTVTRKDFQVYVRTIRQVQGTLRARAVQFARWVPHAQKAEFERQVRADASVQASGYPTYSIFPPGERPFYVPVDFNEPAEGNERAFGLDTAVLPRDGVVFEEPRDTGQPSVSPPIRLVQSDKGAGVVFRAPVYRDGARPTTVVERRASYKGQVSVVVLIDEMLSRDVARSSKEATEVRLTDLGALVTSLATPVTREPLGRFGVAPEASLWRTQYALSRTLPVAGRLWLIERKSSTPNPYLAAKPLLAGALILSLTLLVVGFVRRTAKDRDTAQQIAIQLRENLSRSEELAAALLDATLTGIITLDAEGRIRSANPAARTLFGYSEHQLMGRSFSMLAPDELALLADITLSATVPVGEYHFGATHNITGVSRSGAKIPLAMSLSEIGHGVDHQFLASFHDMSAQKLTEERQRAFAETLEATVQTRTAALTRVNQEMEAFAYSMAHDLRAPVRHVHGFARILELKHSASMDAQGHDYLSRIVRASDDMGRLIDDLLAFSQLSHQTLSMGPVDMGLVVERCLSGLNRDLISHSIDWRISPLPIVRGDEALLGYLMTNLISNAVKYSARSEPAVIEIFADETVAGERRICVRDNGVGLDMQYAHRLFQVFSRLHHRDEFEGTGVGLANVRRIIERHDGRVWVDSKVGEGAAFWIALPA